MTLEELKSWKCPTCGGVAAQSEGGVGSTAPECRCVAKPEPLLTKAEARDFDFEGSDEYAEIRRARHVRSGGRY